MCLNYLSDVLLSITYIDTLILVPLYVGRNNKFNNTEHNKINCNTELTARKTLTLNILRTKIELLVLNTAWLYNIINFTMNSFKSFNR